jgi:DtxR family Mn-dependent transcriptional regulator
MPSAAIEEYLEAIYKLSLMGAVRPAQIADALSVSPPTVTTTLRRLESAKLVSRPAGGGVALTKRGTQEALSIVRRHRLAERFLVDCLGLPWEAAHDEACRLEHALSNRVLVALEAYLDSPDACPHGHPIPSADLKVHARSGVALADVPVGGSGVVVSVPEDDDARLAYFGSISMRPGVSVTVEGAAPFDGPLLVCVAGERVAVDRGVARLIVVKAGA